MQQHVIPLIRTDRHVITDYQDNARPHDACDVMDFLEQKNVNVLPWPAIAPDQQLMMYVMKWKDVLRYLPNQLAKLAEMGPAFIQELESLSTSID